MDKNSITGMLLMGAIIFGFMWLQQPSQEELAARREQAEAQRIEAERQAKADEEMRMLGNVDTVSAGEVNMLRAAVIEYGAVDANGVKTLAADGVKVVLEGDDLNGTIEVNGTSVSVAEALNNTSSNPVTHNRALAKLRTEVNKYVKNGVFAKCLTGTDSVVTLQNDSLKVAISSKGGMITSAVLKKYSAYNAPEVELFDAETNSYSFGLNTNSQHFDTKDFYFTPTEVTDTTVLMQLDLGNGSKWGIKYTLKPDSYIVSMDVVQENMQNVIPSNIPVMDFAWLQRINRHEKGKMFEEQNSGVYYKFLGGDVDNLSETSKDKEDFSDKFKWVSFKNQFFSSVLIADSYFSGAKMNSVPFEKGTSLYNDYLKDVSFNSEIDYSSADANPASFKFFFGPNLYELLAHYDDTLYPDDDLELTRLLPLGWSLFRWINEYFVIPIFDFLSKYIGNAGIVILLLTIIIKIVLAPFQFKSYISQAKMRILAPDIKAINDKYQGQENAMVRSQKTMELYSKAGVNPMSGCLPMLLMMPLLFAMFRFFPSCIQLRGESFLWVQDLSAPDAIWSWDAQIPFITNYFGNHISLFCLLMTVTNIVYTKVSMSSSGNQMPGMKWMMYLMPLMFLVFFNNYAAGLSYYYFLSLLITIIETYSVRLFVKEDKVRAEMAAKAKQPKKKGWWAQKLEEAQRQQKAMMEEQQRRNHNGKGRR
ncbi:MAG: membrane protein insertase YidC [Muribaculaceae bacterium]|nr:membrane protein insertase YidC [Muribaculaceae bacterium]MEE1298669.1 membrane protein insertase YidC [Muribaculaceae bacterium]